MIEKPPQLPYLITDIKTLQDVVTIFGQGINAEHNTGLIAEFLHMEAVELVEAVSEHHDRIKVASEAADVVMFSIETCNILGVPLEQVMAKVRPENPPLNVPDLQKAVSQFIRRPGKAPTIEFLAQFILEQSHKLMYIINATNNPKHIVQEVADTALAAIEILTMLNFSLADILSRKLNRNHHKYNPYVMQELKNNNIQVAKAREMLKAAWDGRRDDEFLTD